MHIMMNKTCGYILSQDHKKQFIYLRLEYKRLLEAFYDFIEHLDSEGYLATIEETSKTLQDLLNYYESQKN